MKIRLGVVLASALAVGCGAGVDPSSNDAARATDLGTAQEKLSATFNGCTYEAFIPTVAPSTFPEWNQDVRGTGTLRCDTAGTYNVLHNLQVWNSTWQSWDGYHIYDPAKFTLAAGVTKSIDNLNWLEPFCYRSSLVIQKFDPATGLRIWSSPAILSGAINLGGACPAGSGEVTPPSLVTLTVTVGGRLGENVISTPGPVNVQSGGAGTVAFAPGTAITLSVTHGRSAIWSGACSSAGQKKQTCTFTLNTYSSVTANIQ